MYVYDSRVVALGAWCAGTCADAILHEVPLVVIGAVLPDLSHDKMRDSFLELNLRPCALRGCCSLRSAWFRLPAQLLKSHASLLDAHWASYADGYFVEAKCPYSARLEAS